MTTPLTTIPVTATADDVARCVSEALVIARQASPMTLADGHAALDREFALQLADLVPPIVRRQTLHVLVASQLSPEQEELIGDAAVAFLFQELVKSGLIALTIAA
jgi:hypothetical protein